MQLCKVSSWAGRSFRESNILWSLVNSVIKTIVKCFSGRSLMAPLAAGFVTWPRLSWWWKIRRWNTLSGPTSSGLVLRLPEGGEDWRKKKKKKIIQELHSLCLCCKYWCGLKWYNALRSAGQDGSPFPRASSGLLWAYTRHHNLWAMFRWTLWWWRLVALRRGAEQTAVLLGKRGAADALLVTSALRWASTHPVGKMSILGEWWRKGPARRPKEVGFYSVFCGSLYFHLPYIKVWDGNGGEIKRIRKSSSLLNTILSFSLLLGWSVKVKE